MKNRILVLIFFVITISLSACSSRAVIFPKDTYTAPPVANLQAENSLAPETIHFYIQGTEFMRGFIAGEIYRKVPRILYDSAQVLWQDSKKSYFRFDYMTQHVTNDYPEYYESRYGGDPVFAYWLDENDFVNEAVAHGEFYSYKWMGTKDSKHKERYVKETEDGKLVYLRKEGDHFDPNYLLQTIKQLDKDSLSVVITDLTDSGFDDTTALLAAFESYLDSGEKKAISIIQIVSEFDGSIYIPDYILKGEILQKNNADAQKNSARAYNGDRPFYILIFGDETINTEYCKKLKENINGDNVKYLLMGAINTGSNKASKQMDILENSEEGLINVITSGSFNKQEKINLDEKGNEYLYYYFFKGSENGKLTLKTPLLGNGVDDLSKIIKARLTVSGIREGIDNKYEEISDSVSAAAVYANTPKVSGSDILTELNFSKSGVESVSLSGSVPKLKAVVELYADLNAYKAAENINEYSITRKNPQTEGENDTTLTEYYGKGTISLDKVVNALWEKYKKQTDDIVGYGIFYIKANKNN